MNRLIFTDRELLIRFVADVLARGGIGICTIPLGAGVVEVRTWDRPINNWRNT